MVSLLTLDWADGSFGIANEEVALLETLDSF